MTKLKKIETTGGGDRSGIDVSSVYDQRGGELKRFISRRVATMEEAEDILQNVFYSLARMDTVSNPIEEISSWLYRTARNKIIDRYRKKKEERLPERSEDNDYGFAALLFDPQTEDGDPEDMFFRSLIRKEIATALEELPAEQRAVFELTEYEGFSFKEISESTSVPVNTLISRKRYAVLYLREKLRELYEDLSDL